ncbi:MAG: DUF4352 domain-containing protein [Lachnospiraceae bacterium]|jgi:hypothetical protein
MRKKRIAWAAAAVAAAGIVMTGGLAGCGSSGSEGTEKTSSADGGSADTEESSAADETEETTAAESIAEETTAAKDKYQVGDTVEAGGMKIVYASSGVYTEESQYLQPAEGNQYIYLDFVFENVGNQDQFVSVYDFTGYADDSAIEQYYQEDSLSATLSSGRTAEGKVIFEVPQDASVIDVEYQPSFLSSDKIVFAYEGEQDSGYQPEASAEATEGAFNPGDTAESDTMIIHYDSCETDTSYSEYFAPKDGYHYATLTFTFENTGDQDLFVSASDFNAFADGSALEMTYFRDDMLSATISTGRTATGTVTFEVPDGASVVEAEYLSNYWTSDHIVFSITE